MPLFTFGKISSLQDAAEEQAKLGEHEVVKERHNVRMDVRKAYNGLLLARNVRALLREASSYLDGAIAKLEKSVDNGDADELDLFKPLSASRACSTWNSRFSAEPRSSAAERKTRL